MAPQTEARILGLSAARAARATVADWVPPTRAQVDAMPLPDAYPAPTWNLAASLLAARSTPGHLWLGQEADDQTTLTAPAPPAAREAEPAPARPDVTAAGPAECPAVDGGAEPPAVPPVTAPVPPDEVPGRIAGREPTPHERLLGDVQGLVRERPEDAAKLVRTVLITESEAGAGNDDLPGMHKVAILFVAIGQETAGEVMRFLSDYEIEEITQALANLKAVTVEMQDRVLEEFQQHLLAGEWAAQGGMDFTRGALERAVGPRKAQEILDRVSRATSSGFYMLKNVAPEQVAPFISHEHPQTIALILSQLDPMQAAGILALLPARMQADVSYRVATMENITPGVLKEIEEALEASLRDILGGDQDVGGPKVVADILNFAGSSVEKNVLDQMEAQDAQIAESVRNLMFTFGDISKLTDRELQILLREIDQKDLVIALKAAGEELKDKILGNLSEEARKSISEEMEFLGPMRLSEVEEVQLRIVQRVRQLEDRDQVTIVRGDSPDVFV